MSKSLDSALDFEEPPSRSRDFLRYLAKKERLKSLGYMELCKVCNSRIRDIREFLSDILRSEVPHKFLNPKDYSYRYIRCPLPSAHGTYYVFAKPK